jgi:hypothetical protein
MNGSYVEAKALVADAARAPRKGPGAPAETETVWRDVAACMLVALQIETCEWDKVRARRARATSHEARIPPLAPSTDPAARESDGWH